MRHLRDEGVEVVSIGKLHFRSAEDDNGFSEEILPMHVVGGNGWPVGLLRDELPSYNSASELAADVGVGNSTYTDYDRDITEAVTAWLQDATRKETPWAAFVSLVSPHYPLTCPEEFYNLYDPAEIGLPVGYEERFRPEHEELKSVAGFFKYEQYFDEQKIREAKAAYCGLTPFMDDCVGKILDTLGVSGQKDKTVVLHISDHGDMMGDQGFRTKYVMYEQSAGLPMIKAGPRMPSANEVSTGVSLVEVYPTALDICDVPEDEESQKLPGTSLKKIAVSLMMPNALS